MAEGAAALRAGLRAVVTKALAGGLAAYLCVRERETLRLRSELPLQQAGPEQLSAASAPEPGCLEGGSLLGARQGCYEPRPVWTSRTTTH